MKKIFTLISLWGSISPTLMTVNSIETVDIKDIKKEICPELNIQEEKNNLQELVLQLQDEINIFKDNLKEYLIHNLKLPIDVLSQKMDNLLFQTLNKINIINSNISDIFVFFEQDESFYDEVPFLSDLLKKY